MTIRTWCSLTIIALAACGGGGTPISETPSEKLPSLLPTDTLAQSVFSLSQDTVIAPLVDQWPSNSDSDGASELVVTSGDADIVAMIYRVQLYTTKDLATAQAVQDEAEVDFGEEAYLDYEIPYYKVRVGTFQTPQEAEPLLQEARRLGYRGAWAVRMRAPEDEP